MSLDIPLISDIYTHDSRSIKSLTSIIGWKERFPLPVGVKLNVPSATDLMYSVLIGC